MTDDRYTPKMITDGKTLLDQLLKSFAERGITGLRPAGDDPTPDSALYHPDNFAAVVVRRNKWGWTADVVLKAVPKGWPDVVGTPEAVPLPTENHALFAGAAILLDMLTSAQGIPAVGASVARL